MEIHSFSVQMDLLQVTVSVSLSLSCFSVIKCFVLQPLVLPLFRHNHIIHFCLPLGFSARYSFTWVEAGRCIWTNCTFSRGTMICPEKTRNNVAVYYRFPYIRLRSPNDTLKKIRYLHWSSQFLSELVFSLVSCRGVRLSSLGTSTTVWPIVPAPWWGWSSRWNENWQGKPKYSERTFRSATLSITNTTWPDLGLNPGRRGGNPATNRLSYGTADIWTNSKERSQSCEAQRAKKFHRIYGT
jgi:hypothetical protein